LNESQDNPLDRPISFGQTIVVVAILAALIVVVLISFRL